MSKTLSILSKKLDTVIIVGMLKARVTLYDPKTGEIIEEYEQGILIGRKPTVDKGFIKVFVGFLKDILEIEEMGSGAWRLLLYVIEKIDFNSLEIYLDPRKVAKDLGVSRATFYNWLNVLLKYRILERIDRRLFRLKPYSAIKGSMDKVIDF